MKKRYTISVFTEDIVGLLNRVTIVFTRRKINIESIAASDSEVQNIHRYTIVVNETEDLVKKVTLQLDKQVEVIKAVYHLDEEIIYQEIALFKVPTDILMQGGEAEHILRAHHARSWCAVWPWSCLRRGRGSVWAEGRRRESESGARRPPRGNAARRWRRWRRRRARACGGSLPALDL